MGNPFRCGPCGKFFKWNSNWDQYIPFGDSTMLEPPDEIFLCEACSNNMEARIVENGRDLISYRGNWVKSRAEINAAEKLGMVLAGPKGAAWSLYFKPEKVPADYEVLNG